MNRMKTLISFYSSKTYWVSRFLTWDLPKAIFAAAGVFAVLIQITSSLAPSLHSRITNEPWMLVLPVALWAIIDRRPVTAVKEKIVGTDVEVEIRVTDMFGVQGAYVIPSNTSFETKPDTIQAQFERRFYGDGSTLVEDLAHDLDSEAYETLDTKDGQRRHYGKGTVGKVTRHNVTAYFLATVDLNKHNVAEATFEDLENSLSRLWHYLAECGDYGTLVTPIMGARRTRIQVQRVVLMRTLIRSFVMANRAGMRFCDKLVVTIKPSTYKTHDDSRVPILL